MKLTNQNKEQNFYGIPIINGDIFSGIHVLISPAIIVHQVNCRGVMGSGIAAQVKNKFPIAYHRYHKTCDRFDSDYLLGKTQVVDVGRGIYVANLFAQNHYNTNWSTTNPGEQKTNYEALTQSLIALNDWRNFSFQDDDYKIRIPYKLSCGRGGGDWDYVQELIDKTLGFKNIEIYRLSAKENA